jgi:alpha-1,2-mannosyltransferase
MRLAWFAATLFVAIFGAGNLVIWIRESLAGPSWWATDLDLWLRAGGRLVAGQALYADPAFLYPPAAAVVAVPLRLLDPFALSIAYAAGKVVLAVVAVGIVARDRPRGERALAVVALVGSLPFLHDVFLGNSNVLLVGAIAVAVFARPSPRSGTALGLAAAVFAKPLLVPVLLWLLVYRRPVLAGTVVAGLATTLAGLVLAGPGAYVAWVGALAAGSRYAVPFAGNHGVTAVVPELWAPVAAVVSIGLVLVLWRRGPDTGLAWAVTSGILIAPYAGTYSALPVAVAMPSFLARQPRVALAIVALSPIATTIPLPLFAAAILVAALWFRERQAAPEDESTAVAEAIAA